MKLVFPEGMTVRELKSIVQEWPEHDPIGLPARVKISYKAGPAQVKLPVVGVCNVGENLVVIGLSDDMLEPPQDKE